MRFSVDRTWRRPDDGDVVIGGSPTRAFRLTPTGRRIAEALERGDDVADDAATLVDRFVDAGAIHPLADPAVHSISGASITAVIPVFLGNTADGAGLGRLVSNLAGLAAVIVVDDASPLPLPAFTAGNTPVRVVRRETNGGPAAARNSGLALVETTHVAFIDADVDCRADDLVALGAWSMAAKAAAIAPRVRTDDDGTVLGAYEAARSPIDMGERPARVRGGTRVSYVPAAVLLCDVDAVRSIVGFDESLRTGEDVDFIWRLDAAGLRCRYEPSIEVFHSRRRTIGEMLHQRSGYGESTARLHSRHGEKVAPAKGSWSSVSSWFALVLGLPVVAAIGATTTAVMLSRKLRFVPNVAVESARLAWMSHLRVGRNLASAVTRVWWPIAVVLALFSRRARVALCAAALVPALAEWWERRPRLDPVRFTLLRVVDDAAYGTGVWKAAWRARDAGAILPSITAPETQNG